jgi:hypothetical protein
VLVVAVALALDLGLTALAIAADLARGSAWSLAVAATALVAVAFARELRPRLGTAVTLAAVWFVLGLVRHVLGDLEPRWASEALSRPGHYAWDAVYHAPPLVLLMLAVGRAPVPERSSS